MRPITKKLMGRKEDLLPCGVIRSNFMSGHWNAIALRAQEEMLESVKHTNADVTV